MIINVKPHACPRPRVTRQGRTYYPMNYKVWTKEFKKAIENMAVPSGCLHVDLVFIVKRPKALKRPKTRVLHYKRPDLDNMVKSVLDALPIADDARVVSLTAAKYYAAIDEEPHIELHLKQILDLKQIKS